MIRNRKEEFISSLTKKTKEDILEWEAFSPGKYSGYIFDSSKIIRLFRTEYRGKDIVLVEKKIPVYNEDYEDYFDQSLIEVYVISETGVELIIDDSSVSESLLQNLLRSVAEEANKISEFIDEFIKSK